MTEHQVEQYQYCEQYLKYLMQAEKGIDNHVKIQRYGCGSGTPNIEHTMQKVHEKFYDAIQTAIKDARKEVGDIIEKI